MNPWTVSVLCFKDICGLIDTALANCDDFEIIFESRYIFYGKNKENQELIRSYYKRDKCHITFVGVDLSILSDILFQQQIHKVITILNPYSTNTKMCFSFQSEMESMLVFYEKDGNWKCKVYQVKNSRNIRTCKFAEMGNAIAFNNNISYTVDSRDFITMKFNFEEHPIPICNTTQRRSININLMIKNQMSDSFDIIYQSECELQKRNVIYLIKSSLGLKNSLINGKYMQTEFNALKSRRIVVMKSLKIRFHKSFLNDFYI